MLAVGRAQAIEGVNQGAGLLIGISLPFREEGQGLLEPAFGCFVVPRLAGDQAQLGQAPGFIDPLPGGLAGG